MDWSWSCCWSYFIVAIWGRCCCCCCCWKLTDFSHFLCYCQLLLNIISFFVEDFHGIFCILVSWYDGWMDGCLVDWWLAFHEFTSLRIPSSTWFFLATFIRAFSTYFWSWSHFCCPPFLTFCDSPFGPPECLAYSFSLSSHYRHLLPIYGILKLFQTTTNLSQSGQWKGILFTENAFKGYLKRLWSSLGYSSSSGISTTATTTTSFWKFSSSPWRLLPCDVE